MIQGRCEKMEMKGASLPQTSVPDGWELTLLGELGTIFSGGTPNRKNPEYWDGDIPWVTTTLIGGDEIFEANEFITQKGLKGSSAKWCKAGTILMAMYGQGKTRGKVALLGIDATINQACAAIELNELCSRKYVLHLLSSKYENIRELSNSGGQENLSSGIIKLLEVLLPPQKEQIIIANVLSDTDALIIALEQLITKKQAIKTATMQQLLTGRTRLPQFTKHSDDSVKTYKLSELGLIPSDWEVIKLGEIAKFLKGSGLPKSELSDDGAHLCIHYGQLFTFYGPQIKEVKSKTNFNGLIKSERNDVLMPTSDVTPNGLATASCMTESEVTLGGDILIIRANEKILNGVYFSYLVTVMRDQIMQLVTGSTVYHLYGSDMAKLCFAIPPENEQTAIATILSDMDDELEALEQKLSKVRDIKQGIMQQLLTGRIRLPLDQQL